MWAQGCVAGVLPNLRRAGLRAMQGCPRGESLALGSAWIAVRPFVELEAMLLR